MILWRRPEDAEKAQAELRYWTAHLDETGIGPRTLYYQTFMMQMGNVTDLTFFDGKVCLDIGCGPLGSLEWLSNAKAAIGLDPLANDYMQFGISRQRMIYLNAHAEAIPLPDRYVDVVFSMNSLDHVHNLYDACREIRRVLKPGGHFIGSLNLLEPATPTEPWMLTEELLGAHLFSGWEREYYSIRPKVDSDPLPYRYFHEECPQEIWDAGHSQALWCRFRVPADAAD